MIQLDRDAPLTIADQLVEGLRFEIAAGRHRPGERLPSTREMADRLSISFHTVRKAYQKLEAEGVLDVRRGGGFYVAERQALSRAERLERAAGVVHDALQKLVGLGLSEDEVDYAVHEGLEFFERPGPRRALHFVAACREAAESGAEQATGALQERVVPVALADLAREGASDGLIAPMPLLHEARRLRPEADAVGVVVQVDAGVLERAARLVAPEVLGLVVRHADAVAPMSDDVRARTGFAGTLLAIPVDAERRQLDAVIRQADLLLYTPQARRRVRPLLTGERPAAEWAPTLAPESMARLRDALGR